MNFIDKIEAKLTGRRSAEDVPLLAVDIKRPIRPELMSILDEYRIKIEYGAYFTCKASELPHCIKNVVESLRREVYGDFHAKLLKLQRATYNQKREMQLKLIDELLREIRGEG